MTAAEYYTDTNTPGTRSLAQSLAMRNEFDLVAVGFGKLPDLSGFELNAVFVNSAGNALESVSASVAATRLGIPDGDDLKLGAANNATTTGSANAYVASISNITALSDFLRISLKIHTGNTGATTLNVSSTGATIIKRLDGSDLQSGDLVGDRIYEFFYNSSTGYWHLDTYMFDPLTGDTNPSVNQITSTTVNTTISNSTTVINTGKTYSQYFRSKEVTVDIVGGTATIDLEAGDVHYLDMDANCALAFTNAPAAGEAQTSLLFVNNQSSYTFSGLSGTDFDIKIISGETVTQPTASGKDLYVLTIIPSANVLLIAQIPNWVAP